MSQHRGSYIEVELRSLPDRTDGGTTTLSLPSDDDDELVQPERIKKTSSQQSNELSKTEIYVFTTIYVVAMTVLMIMFEVFKPVLRPVPSVYLE